MPLIKSKSEPAFKQNVSEMIRAGHPRDQALAAAYRNQRQSKAGGGALSSPPFWARSAAHDLERSGFIHGYTGGRTDAVPARVRNNGYVIPADIVSGIGQGNSLAGAHALGSMFKMGPYGAGAVQAPAMPHMGHFASGGAPATTDIAISDGEFFVPPEKVAEIGGGNIKHGHDILDAMVKHIRKKTIKTLRKLPAPKKN